MRFGSPASDCSVLSAFIAAQPDATQLLIDYVTFATPTRCWSAEAREAVDSAIADIARTEQPLTRSAQTMTLYLIPAG